MAAVAAALGMVRVEKVGMVRVAVGMARVVVAMETETETEAAAVDSEQAEVAVAAVATIVVMGTMAASTLPSLDIRRKSQIPRRSCRPWTPLLMGPMGHNTSSHSP